MGAIISREQRPTIARKRCGDLAEDALKSARAYRKDIGGPIIRGAIMAYIDEDIDETRLARDCTLLEVCGLFFRGKDISSLTIMGIGERIRTSCSPDLQ